MQALTNLTNSIITGFSHLERIEESACIQAEQPDQGIAQLANAIAKGAPEAGAPFWRLRVWGMLIWQPVYLAILSAYRLQTSIDNFEQLTLKQTAHYTLGYQLPENSRTIHHDSIDEAIDQLAPALTTLCQGYAEALCEQMPVRQPLLMAILADTLFTTLEHLINQNMLVVSDHNKAQWLFQQGQKWCQLMNLTVPKTAQRLLVQETSFQRKTCCLIYRCHGAKECANCPRLVAKQKDPIAL